jgi:hypothetical protein
MLLPGRLTAAARLIATAVQATAHKAVVRVQLDVRVLLLAKRPETATAAGRIVVAKTTVVAV